MDEKKHEQEFYTVKDLALKLRISDRTIYNQLSAGTFPIRPKRIGNRLIRFHRDSINTYLESL